MKIIKGMKILKFGSATIGSVEKIKSVVSIIEKKAGNLIVFSSIKGTAESLSEISKYLYKKNQEGASEIINDLEQYYKSLINALLTEQKYIDNALSSLNDTFQYIRSFSNDLFTLFEERALMAQGELLSTSLFELLLTEKGFKVRVLPALDFVRTDKTSVPDQLYLKENLSLLLSEAEKADIYITQGYICRNAYGEIDDLRKGGSDYTASLIGVALSAEEIEIWADCDVMQNNDSRYVKNTKAIPQLNFDEAAELTYFGSKILHPSSILPAKIGDVPIRLKNTNYPQSEGTLISNKLEHNVIKAIAAREGITSVQIKSAKMLLAHGFLRRIFEVFDDYQTPIDMLTTSEVGVSLTIDDDQKLSNIVDDLKKYGTVSFDRDMAIVSIVGDLDWTTSHVMSDIMDALKNIPLRMISYGGSNYNMSFLVRREDKEQVLQLLNNIFFNE